MSGGTNWPWALSVLTALVLAVGMFWWVRAGTKKWLPRGARKPFLYILMFGGGFALFASRQMVPETMLSILILVQLAVMFGVMTAD